MLKNNTLEIKHLLLGTCHSTRGMIYECFGASKTGVRKHKLLGALALVSRTKKIA
jgi:hypothetical protein